MVVVLVVDDNVCWMWCWLMVVLVMVEPIGGGENGINVDEVIFSICWTKLT